ncbi:hypothetical protein B0H11DRAFT_1996731, partial [Mycena galericulata]
MCITPKRRCARRPVVSDWLKPAAAITARTKSPPDSVRIRTGGVDDDVPTFSDRTPAVLDLEVDNCPWRHAVVSPASIDCVLWFHTNRGIDGPGEAGGDNRGGLNDRPRFIPDGVVNVRNLVQHACIPLKTKKKKVNRDPGDNPGCGTHGIHWTPLWARIELSVGDEAWSYLHRLCAESVKYGSKGRGRGTMYGVLT